MVDVSVIIPVYNAEKTISLLLKALSRQSTDKVFEIILVDNESNDATSKIIESVTSDFSIPLKVLSQPRGVTISAVRNFGVKNSSGRVLAFIDSDCVPGSDWLQLGCEQVAYFGEEVLLAGGYQPPPISTWVERAWHSTRSGHKEGSFFVHGGNFFIPRDLFDDVGGFRERIETSEDYDLGRRVAMKYKVISVPNFTVLHYGEANTIVKKIKKERWYSKNIFDSLSQDFFYKPFWVSIFFLFLVFSSMFSIFLFSKKVTFIIVLLTFITPVALALFFCQRAKNYKYFLSMVPISFAYLLGRGFGILDGLVSGVLFRRRERN